MVAVVSWAVFFGVLLAPTFSRAEDGFFGLGLLQRMSQASRQLTYSGTFVYRGGSRMETSSIAHTQLEGRELERIEVLDGSPREVIRDGDEIKCFFPEDNRVIVENRTAQRRFPALLPAGLGDLQDHYLIRVGGNGRIAGMTSRIIRLEPRDGFRYGHEFWMDAGSGLLLKASIISEQDEVLESFAFTQVQVGGMLGRDAFRPRFSGAANMFMRQVRTAEVNGNELGWNFRAGVPGFRQVSAMKRQSMAGQAEGLHILFSDGLASISVFIEPGVSGDNMAHAEGVTRLGALSVYRRAIDGYRLVVMGEVPAITVRRLGDGIERRHR